MNTKARMPLLSVYALLAACGLISLFSPLQSVETAMQIPVLVRVWGLFFLVGGLVSFVALYARTAEGGRILGWWYIEISGICLLAAATLIYAAVVVGVFAVSGQMHLLALVGLVLALSSSLIDRAVDAWRHVKLEKELLREIAFRDRRS